MRVYLAADSSLQQEMRRLRAYLAFRGVTVTSRWLDIELENSKIEAGKVSYTEAELGDWAFKDLSDIDQAEIFICYNPVSHHRGGTGGRHVEFGYAYARGKRLVYCGEKKENIFHRLSHLSINLEAFDRIEELGKTLIHSLSYVNSGPSKR